MVDAKFDALVARLETLAARRPKAYIAVAVSVAALGLAILGLAVGFALFGAVAVAAIAFIIVAKVHIGAIAVHAVKLLLLLLIPAYTMVKASVTLLFARFPEPEGRALSPAEAPELFAVLDRLRRDMKGPAVHAVLLTDELNAAIVQHPRFGLMGWEKNILILGLPLLQVLSAEEALSVVAHEYGHLSGYHGRLGGFIYRFRSTWKRLQELSSQWRDWGSRLVARLFRWYEPYFNAYTFVLARQNEYLADRTAAEVAGAGNTANALMRINMAALFEHRDFWPGINRQAAIDPEPIASRSAVWQESVQAVFREPLNAALLSEARQRKTDHLDTHPALTDRLAALGVDVDERSLERLEPAARTAAAAWLGSSLDPIRTELDQSWRAAVVDNWHQRHAQMTERRRRLDELDAQGELTADERWERVLVLGDVRPEEDVQQEIEAVLAEKPDHLPARFRRGMLRLQRDDAAGIADLEAVMAADPDAISPGCQAAWLFYQNRDPELAERYRRRWLDYSARRAAMDNEKQVLADDARLAPVDLDRATVATIAALVREHGPEVRRAYLVRRTLDAELDVHDYIVTLETALFTGAAAAQEIINRVAAPPYPVGMMIFHLDAQQRRRFHRRMRRLGIDPLPLA